MALKDDIPVLLQHINKNVDILAHNAELFNIWEGDLLSSILIDLSKQLSPKNFEQIKHRISPVNVLRRLIDKLAKIYSEAPTRWLLNDSQKDKDLFDQYRKWSRLDQSMSMANEFFNLFKNTLIESYVYKGKPKLRIIPSDRFLVYSSNKEDPTCVTHVIKFMGNITIETKKGNKTVPLYYGYTDTEFLPFTSEGEIVYDILNQVNNPEGINPFGKLPFVYINRSHHNLIPVPDTDTLKMTKIFPILLSDLNFSVMFQAFSIVYGINIDDENIEMSPNAFWRFKSDPTSNAKPELGVIKPQVDITQVTAFISSMLSFWLQSRNIRPGSTGSVGPENFSSGVSKIVDEMDTYEDRNKQIPYFQDAEHELFDLIINYQWPYWIKEGIISETRMFDPGQEIISEFPEQQPLVSRTEIIAQVKEELALDLTTRKDAIMRLNPDMSEQDVEDFIKEIDQENTVEVYSSPQTSQADMNQSVDQNYNQPDQQNG